jgi:hypothetical protein
MKDTRNASSAEPPAVVGVRASKLFFTTMIAALQDARILAAYAAPAVPEAWRSWEDTVKQRIEFGTAWLRVGLSVVDEIAIERARLAKDFSSDEDDRATPDDWVRQIKSAATRSTRLRNFGDDFRSAMIRVAALSIAAIETHDRHKMRHTEANSELSRGVK